MIKSIKILTCLVIFNLICICEVFALVEFDASKKLALTLSFENTDNKTTPNKLHLVVKLQNKTDEVLKYTISTNPPPLTFDLWDRKGNNLSLKYTPVVVKNRNNPGKELVIKANENIVFKREFDLSIYSEDLTPESVVMLEASIVFFQYKNETMYYSRLISNKLNYTVP